MAYIEIKAYKLKCDGCGEYFPHENGGELFCAGIDHFEGYLYDSDWKEQGDKAYCPECVSFCEHDNCEIIYPVEACFLCGLTFCAEHFPGHKCEP